MKRIDALLPGFLVALLIVPAAWAYDAEMAQTYAKMFEPVQGMKAGKVLHV